MWASLRGDKTSTLTDIIKTVNRLEADNAEFVTSESEPKEYEHASRMIMPQKIVQHALKAY